jgi:hypothetical protein
MRYIFPGNLKPVISYFPSRQRSRSRIGFALSLSAFFVVQMTSDVAQAGFLEDLFGFGGEQRAVEVPRAPRETDRSRRRGSNWQSNLSYLKQSHQRRHASAHRDSDEKVAGSAAVKKSFCYDQAAQAADPGQTEGLLHDTTLRSGDIVATAEGLRVYEGGGGCPHKAGDFLALASARDLSSTKRNSLVAIENAMKARLNSGQVRSLLFSAKETTSR